MPIFAKPERRDEINFHFAKRLPYNVRLAVILALLAGGLLVQLLLLRVAAAFWTGAALVAAASLLGVVRGYTNVPKKKGQPAKDFERATRQEFEKVLDIHERSKRWDRNVVDITCWRGFGMLLLLIGAIGLVYYSLSKADEEALAKIWVADTVLFFLPHWVTGVRSILKNPPLIIKIENFLGLCDQFEGLREEGEEMEYWLRLAKSSAGEYPIDAKLMLKFKDAPESFLGLQTQIAINDVQGTDYPYLYCVLVAKGDFGLQESAGLPKGLVAERQSDGDVDVLVIRKRTTQTSGYHTNFPAMLSIFNVSLALARRLIAEQLRVGS